MLPLSPQIHSVKFVCQSHAVQVVRIYFETGIIVTLNLAWATGFDLKTHPQLHNTHAQPNVTLNETLKSGWLNLL